MPKKEGEAERKCEKEREGCLSGKERGRGSERERERERE